MTTVNSSLAPYSDLSFGSAFVVYILALVLSVVYYTVSQPSVSEKLDAEALALVNERRAVRARKCAGMTQALVVLGLVLQGVSVIIRGVAAHRFPFGNLYEYVSLISFGTILVFAVMIYLRGLVSLWPWVLTPIIALLFFGATKLYAGTAPVVPALQSIWLPIHVATIAVGASIALVSGLSSILYLLRAWQPRGSEHGVWGRVVRPLPGIRTLDALAYRTAIWALPLFGLGTVFGAIWASKAWGRFWGWDPKETMAFVTWIIMAAYLHARATSGWRNTKAAWINVLAFAAMIFNLFFINIFVSGLHSYAGLN